MKTLINAAAVAAFAAHAVYAQSVDLDKKIGAEAAEQVLRTKGLYEDAELSRLFSNLGARLVNGLGDQPFTYRFAISDEREPNAYALPGGYVFATRTIFAIADSESELAGIIGHEIIHAHKRHSVKSARRSILPGVLSIPGGLAGIFSQQAGQILTAPASLMMASHSRKDEAEADNLGVQLAAAAGYDPLALKTCLDRLTKTIEQFLGEKEKKSYFDDHPATADRMEAIAKVAAQSKRSEMPPILAGRDAYLRMIDGLVLGPNPQQGLFDGRTFVHPDLNFRMEMPEGWKTFNSASAFGAVEPKGKGQLVVGLIEGGQDPESAGKQTLGYLEQRAQKTPAEARAVDVNGHPGFYAMYVEKKTNLHLLWVSMGGKMFRMAGVGGDPWKEALRQAALSLRPLTTAEKSKVPVLRLRIEAARDGETLTTFCDRTRSAFKPQLIQVLNGIEGETLSQGRKLKIARLEPYKAGR
jgi:predicted Zn-dependent protease